MPYRFLLEVPDSLVDDAKIVVTNVPDAGVVVARASHGTGFDYPTTDLTISGESLRVVQAIYKWVDDINAQAPFARTPIRFAALRGDRIPVGDLSYDQAVAAIRRDQPWVDRSIPKIGEHETRTSPFDAASQTLAATLAAHGEFTGPATLPAHMHLSRITILATDNVDAHDTINVDGTRALLLKVYDLAKPERLYGELFGTELVGRGDKPQGHRWVFYPASYDIEQEAQHGDEPEYAFLQNGNLAIALQRIGRGYPIDRYAQLPEPIHLLVDRPALATIRAHVMMNSWHVLETLPDALVFRDPMGYVWAVVGHDPQDPETEPHA